MSEAGGASSAKITFASAPSSSTTRTGTSSTARVSSRHTSASSKSDGRMPTTTGPEWPARRSVTGSRWPPNTTWPFSIVASNRFIDGEPMKAATNMLTGFA